MNLPRCSGVLLHPTSLPSPHGIGTLGQEAYDWVDFLDRTGQTIWQVLPLGPTSFGDSPYQSFSTHAGNPYLIGLRKMMDDGLMEEAELAAPPSFDDPSKVDFGLMHEWKLPLLKRAAARFGGSEEFDAFCASEKGWLDDYALFMALKDAHGHKAWNEWDADLRLRKAKALAAARREHRDAIRAHQFVQWVFDRQWKELRAYANERGLQIMGDIPIFVAMDSADAWTNQGLFHFDKQGQPTVVAGVPPDYFAETGQLWGNPLYRWEEHRKTGYAWWLERLRSALGRYDVIRIDHFRGFAQYWEVPAGEETAVNGKWVDGPGGHFFETLQKELGDDLPIIAEDLGDIDETVTDLRDQFHLPGMKVMQFAFGGKPSDPFLPHNYTENFVAYSGTHDNDTTRGWYEESSKEPERDYFRRYFATDARDVAWTMIRAVFASVARVAVVPLQDILDLGASARMNLPGRPADNWTWRFQAEQLGRIQEGRLAELTWLYGRERPKAVQEEPTADPQKPAGHQGEVA